jgi:hypothetical protein
MLWLQPVPQRRVEAAAILVAAALAYDELGFAWSSFAIFFFAPDLSILAYLLGPRAGGRAYNCAHFYGWPAALGVIGALAGAPLALQAALIWGTHVAFDRVLGWGLKTEESFCHTDMGRKTLPVSVRFLEARPG